MGGLETALAVEVVQVMQTRFERTPPRQHLVPLRAPGRRVTAAAKVIPLRLVFVVAVVVIACASREGPVDRFERPVWRSVLAVPRKQDDFDGR